MSREINDCGRDALNRITRRAFLTQSTIAGIGAGLLPLAGCGGESQDSSGGPSILKGSRSARPNIVFLSLDTTRADHLSCYGYERETTPHLDRLAEGTQFFERAVSTSSWTLPAHMSMFTGKYVSSHGVRKDPSGALHLGDAVSLEQAEDHVPIRPVSPSERLLPEVLQSAGYATGAVVAGPWLKKVFHFDRGFDYHDDDNIVKLDGNTKRLGNEITDRAIGWLDSLSDSPFFLFLNYFDPHGPYLLPSEEWNRFKRDGPPPSGQWEHLRLYDNQIYFMDSMIGRLIDHLKRRDLYDNTLFIVIADHGELLYEHGIVGHGKNLYEPLLHVPFFVKYPHGEMPPKRYDHYVQPTDILPLVLDRIGLEVWDGIQGANPLKPAKRPVLAEVYPSPSESEDGHHQALYDGSYKFILNSLGNHKLFNLKTDPGEERNLLAAEPDRAMQFQARIMNLLDGLPRPDGAAVPIEIDEETRRQLEALGYL